MHHESSVWDKKRKLFAFALALVVVLLFRPNTNMWWNIRYGDHSFAFNGRACGERRAVITVTNILSHIAVGVSMSRNSWKFIHLHMSNSVWNWIFSVFSCFVCVGVTNIYICFVLQRDMSNPYTHSSIRDAHILHIHMPFTKYVHYQMGGGCTEIYGIYDIHQQSNQHTVSLASAQKTYSI